MSKICPNCNQILDDSVEKCPFCGNNLVSSNNENKLDDIVEVSTAPEVNAIPESNLVVPPWVDNASEINNSTVSDIVETPTVVPNSIQEPSTVTPMEQVPVVEQQPVPEVDSNNSVVVEPIFNQVPIKEIGNVTQVEPLIEQPVNQVIEPNPVQEPSAVTPMEQVPVVEQQPVPEVDLNNSVVVEPSNQVNIPIQEVPSLDNSVAFEEISVDSIPTLQLNTMGPPSNEAPSSQPNSNNIEAPVLPAASIGEVSLDNLASGYDREEELNNERRIERDRQREERMRMEAEAQKNIVISKPDLLAVNSQLNIEQNIIPTDVPSEIKVKPIKKSRKKTNHKVILDLLTVIAVIVIVIVFLLLLDKKDNSPKKEQELDYMKPIDMYYEGYSEGNSTTMLSAYLPCLSTSDDITTSVNITVTDRLQYKTFNVDHVEEKVEVVNADDKDALKEYISEQCDVNTPTITEFRYVYIKQTTITEENGKAEESNPKIYVGKVDNKWYILAFQGK